MYIIEDNTAVLKSYTLFEHSLYMVIFHVTLTRISFTCDTVDFVGSKRDFNDIQQTQDHHSDVFHDILHIICF